MYDFHIRLMEAGDMNLTVAELTDVHGNSIAKRAWLDKEYPDSMEKLGNIIRAVADDMFPKKSAPENKEVKSTVKTPRGKAK